ncbi:MAG: hypothetical protein SH847_17910 [Roseiflexaceae bacterium]|nr:hypothetical protein [Roseiflexaceae bacterium]
MNDDTQRRIIYGLLSLVLGIVAAQLAQYLTDKILGAAPEGSKLI